ncbi:tRNA pseudouridine(13) synthase TruD [Candidatus Woesearchaeota archaeon]|nr:tRNA pseudouridine(13) synthase TruD [Candidatus Woesearchaeota archaeon]
MKLRQLAADFMVEEVPKAKVLTSGQHQLFLLEKQSMETFSLIGYIAQKNNIPTGKIGIAGLKDRHAITKQFLTIPTAYPISNMEEKNFSLTKLGYVNEPLQRGELEANRFSIVVRDIAKGELTGISTKASTLGSIGVPNYYDSQRFGSVIKKQFMAKAAMRGEYEKAVWLYLTEYTKSEKSVIKQEKRMIASAWPKFPEVKHGSLAKVIKAYRSTKDWQKAYEAIPFHLREMFDHAYQSYLWNECLKELLKKNVGQQNLYPVPYAVGSLLFYKKLDHPLPISFPTVGRGLQTNAIEQEIITKVLQKESISEASCEIWRSEQRDIVLKPMDFSISREEGDELNKRRWKIKVCFTLQPGSYATIILKRLFNQ